jgi:hypothetical protein
MKSYILIPLLWSISAVCHAEKQLVLDLSDGITWKGVFDAGFRPKHLSDGIYMCRQYDVDLSIRFSSEVLLPLGRGDIDFSVKENNLIIGFSFFGRENRSLDEARQKSSAFAKMFEGYVTQRAGLKTFQTRHKVDYIGRKVAPREIEEHVDLKTTTNAAKIGDFSIIYIFRDSYMNDLPLVERLSVALKSQEARRAKRLTEKIRPPEGYEHISLEPNQYDDITEKESHGTETNREHGNPGIPKPWVKAEVAQEATTVTEYPKRLARIVGGVLLTGILILQIWAFIRGRASE